MSDLLTNQLDTALAQAEIIKNSYIDCCNALLRKGAPISSGVKFSDFPNLVREIEGDNYIGFIEEEGEAQRLTVPKAAEFARIGYVGGMTHKKENQTILEPSSYNYEVYNNIRTIGGDTFEVMGGEYSVQYVVYFQPTTKEVYKFEHMVEFNPGIEIHGSSVMHISIIQDGETTDYRSYECVGPQLFVEYDVVLQDWNSDTDYFLIEIIGNAPSIGEIYWYAPRLIKTEYTLNSAKVTSLKSEGANLIPFPYYETTKTLNGITFTVNSDGSITANGTATENSYFRIVKDWANFNLPKGNYYFSGVPSDGAWNTYRMNIAFKTAEGTTVADIIETGKGSQFNISENASKMYFVINIFSGVTVNNITFYPMLNYGSTPAPFTPYIGTLDTLAIPEAVQSLPDYGDGVNSEYFNYIDFERKVYVQRVREVVFDGSESWVYEPVNGGKYVRLYHLVRDFPPIIHNDNNALAPCLCNHYSTVSVNNGWYYGAEGVTANTQPDGSNPRLYIYTSEYPSVDEWKKHLAELYANNEPLVIIYTLAEPIETDISEILDSYIKTEQGGTITFENQDRLPTQYKITYITTPEEGD